MIIGKETVLESRIQGSPISRYIESSMINSKYCFRDKYLLTMDSFWAALEGRVHLTTEQLYILNGLYGDSDEYGIYN